MWINLVLTLTVGALGGLLLFKLKAPAGMLIGAILAVTLLNVTTPYVVMPLSFKVVAQIITGAYIGTTISKEDIFHVPRILQPYLIVMGSFFVLNIISGLLIYWLSPLDLLTSLLCSMPGGVSDTPLIAMDMGADAPKVALMQFVRMIFGLGGIPTLVVMLDRLAEQRECIGEPLPCEFPPDSSVEAAKKPQKHPVYALPVTLAVAAAGGLLGKYLGIPAGALVISMVITIIFKLLYSGAFMPRWCRRMAQILSGCCIGSQIALKDLIDLRLMIIPALILVIGYFANCVITGNLLHRWCGLTRREGMLCVSPAGATEMALIAADLGVCSTTLIVIQICRLVGVMAIFPQIFSVIIAVFS